MKWWMHSRGYIIPPPKRRKSAMYDLPIPEPLTAEQRKYRRRKEIREQIEDEIYEKELRAKMKDKPTGFNISCESYTVFISDGNSTIEVERANINHLVDSLKVLT